jgi:hypothetical protein
VLEGDVEQGPSAWHPPPLLLLLPMWNSTPSQTNLYHFLPPPWHQALNLTGSRILKTIPTTTVTTTNHLLQSLPLLLVPHLPHLLLSISLQLHLPRLNVIQPLPIVVLPTLHLPTRMVVVEAPS